MSGKFPTEPGFQALDFRSVKFNVQSEAISGRSLSRSLGGQRYEFTVRHDSISRDKWLPVQAFLEAQEGSVDTFQIALPIYSQQPGDATGVIQSSAAAAIGDRSVPVDGITAGTLKAGGYIRWTNHSKVYMVTADLSAPGSLSIYPPLIEAVPDNDVLLYNDVEFTVRLAGDTQMYTTRRDSRVSYEQDMQEAF